MNTVEILVWVFLYIIPCVIMLAERGHKFYERLRDEKKYGTIQDQLTYFEIFFTLMFAFVPIFNLCIVIILLGDRPVIRNKR